MVEHTKEPWAYGEASNYVGFWIAPRGTLPTLASVERPRGNPNSCSIHVHNFPGETEANARRIVAAVNACAGIATEALELILKYDGLAPLLSQLREVIDANLENEPSSHGLGRLHALLESLVGWGVK